ncbi:MAG: pilus assembly protein [Cyanobacteria bacterium]|nr:pilus assembly protein [Cyanobacteriota bacterium]
MRGFSAQVGHVGQALLEFVIVLPVLALVLIATYAMGGVMYTGSYASSALKYAGDDKLLLAAQPNGNAALNMLTTRASTYPGGGVFPFSGNPIDGAVTPQNLASGGPGGFQALKVNGVFTASKQITMPLVPTIQFQVTQALPGKLFENNQGTGAVPVSQAQTVLVDPVKAQDYYNYVQSQITSIYQFSSGIPLTVPYMGGSCAGPATPVTWGDFIGALGSSSPFPSAIAGAPSGIDSQGAIQSRFPVSMPGSISSLIAINSDSAVCNSSAASNNYGAQCVLEGRIASPGVPAPACVADKQRSCSKAYLALLFKDANWKFDQQGGCQTTANRYYTASQMAANSANYTTNFTYWSAANALVAGGARDVY